jgi:uncharacterized RDD family membrane protein YckC
VPDGAPRLRRCASQHDARRATGPLLAPHRLIVSSFPPPGGPPGYPPPPPAYPTFPASAYSPPTQCAGFWIRVATSLLDGLFGQLVMLPFLVPFFVLVQNTFVCRETRTDFGYTQNDCTLEHPGRFVAAMVIFSVGELIWIVLNIRWIAHRGQSLAMRITNLRVVRPDTMRPIGTGRSIGRFFASVLSGICCCLGYLWAAWEPRHRTWHDMICDTIVIQE